MADFNESNERPNLMKSDYSDNKYDKSNELSEDMSITQSSQDEVTRKLNNLGGSDNG